MNKKHTPEQIALRAEALRKVMETTMHSATQDIGKWIGSRSYAVSYNEIARSYREAMGGSSINIFDIDEIPDMGDMTWIAQKQLFDSVYIQVSLLCASTTPIKPEKTGPLYNLFVSGSKTSWNGDVFEIDLSRCVREYTDTRITERYGALDASAIAELKRLPCIFAYEIRPRIGS